MNFYFRVLFQFKKLKLFYTILNNVSSTVKNLGESDCHRQSDRAIRSGQVIAKFQNQIQFL
ncbi:hypothetical protein [Leptospira interrogans]|uniref:hypothetical protein n=1 Tax=Leptospira interrogans TaxID=173 RepID=UPI000347B64C|nr:hypothetical protein [Leptospira interrogans]